MNRRRRRFVLHGLVFISGLLFTAAFSVAQITTVAGWGSAAYSGNGGPAAQARLNFPTALAVDAAGNIFFADTANHRIRRISPDGVITDVAGGGFRLDPGTGDPASDDLYRDPGPGDTATSVALQFPAGVAVGSDGSVYVPRRFQVLVVNPSGNVTAIIGNGTQGFSGDGGDARDAQLNFPQALAVDALGNLYIADTGNRRIRRVDPGGRITTYAGNGEDDSSGDGGNARSASMRYPWGLALDPEGNLYISESPLDSADSRIRKVSPDGIITTIAGGSAPGFSGDGRPASEARLRGPVGLALDGNGNLYIADRLNSRVRRINSSGFIATVAGDGSFGFSGDGGPPGEAQFNGPAGVAVDADGNLLIADSGNNRIRRVNGEDIPNISIRSVTPPSITLFPGGDSETISVTIERTAYTGNIDLTTRGVPPGVGGSITEPRGGGSGTISLSARSTADAVAHREVSITLSGEGVSPVTTSFLVTVGALVPTLQVEPTSLSFAGVAGGANPPDRTLAVSDASGGMLAWIAGATSAGNWLSVSPETGTNATPLIVSANTSGLPPETYSGTIDVVADGLAGSPLTIPVTLTLAPPPDDFPLLSQGGIVNNASYTLASASVAPGSIVAIFGSNLTDGSSCLPPSCNPSFNSDGRLNTLLSGAEVKVNGAPVPIFYATPTQLGVQMPADLAEASAEFVVSVGNQSSLPQTVLVEPVSPGIFSLTGDGRGPGAVTHADGSPLSAQNPARPGESLILYATGLGQVTPPVATGSLPAGESRAVAPVTVIIDSITVTPDFAGLAGCCVGLNQVNFRVPENVRSGDGILVLLTAAGKQSNLVTIPVQP